MKMKTLEISWQLANDQKNHAFTCHEKDQWMEDAHTQPKTHLGSKNSQMLSLQKEALALERHLHVLLPLP